MAEEKASMLAAFMEKQAPKPAKGRESDALYLQQGTNTQAHMHQAQTTHSMCQQRNGVCT